MPRRIISLILILTLFISLTPQVFAADTASKDGTENPEDWDDMFESLTLTGDWRKDLVAVAGTQIGYTESKTNCIMIPDSYGIRYTRYGYTRYGHWFDTVRGEYMYRPWCAMFISFCMYYAGIPGEKLPYNCDCGSWRDAFMALGCYEGEEDEYSPQSGDLIFFNWETGLAGNHEIPEHVGIVEHVSDDTVYTIEGNADYSSSVVQRSYAKDDLFIVGYCNMSRAMELAGIDTAEEK